MGQRIGARTVDMVVGVVLFVIPYLTVSNDRDLARLFLGVSLLAAYETVFVLTVGSTPGKIIAGTRVAALDHTGIDPGDAIKRGLMVAASSVILILSPLLVLGAAAGGGGLAVLALVATAIAAGILVSVFGSAIRRSFIDRLCGTVVVVRTTPDPVSMSMLTESREELRVDTRWGPLATFAERRRARASRLDDAPVLVLVLLAVVFATSIPDLSRWVVFALVAGWEVVFVIDETWRISRRGRTSGHRELGLAVVDLRTGEAPSPGRSLVRAVLLSLPLYLLPVGAIASVRLMADHPMMLVVLIVCLALILGFLGSLRMGLGRGLHDLAANTVVIELSDAAGTRG